MVLRIEFGRLRVFRRLRDLEERVDTMDKRLQQLELRAMAEDCRIRRVNRSPDPEEDTEGRPAEQPQEPDSSKEHTQHTQQELREWLLFRDEYPKEGDV